MMFSIASLPIIIAPNSMGKPNAFISRPGVAGEHSKEGGFYVADGPTSEHNATGYSVRFHVNPKARFGIDFRNWDKTIGTARPQAWIFHNANALTVVDSSDGLPSPVDYFQQFLRSDTVPMDEGDRVRLRLRMRDKELEISSEDLNKIMSLVRANVENWRLFKEWFSWGISARFPEFADELFRSNQPSVNSYFLQYLLTQPHWKSHALRWAQALIKNGYNQPVAAYLLHGSSSVQFLPLLDELLENNLADDEIMQALRQPEWRDHPALRLLCRGAQPTLTCLREVHNQGLTIAAALKGVSGSQLGNCIRSQI